MEQVLTGLGVTCLAAAVLLSIAMNLRVKKQSQQRSQAVERYVLYTVLARTLLCVVAAAFFVLSVVVK